MVAIHKLFKKHLPKLSNLCCLTLISNTHANCEQCTSLFVQSQEDTHDEEPPVQSPTELVLPPPVDVLSYPSSPPELTEVCCYNMLCV